MAAPRRAGGLQVGLNERNRKNDLHYKVSIRKLNANVNTGYKKNLQKRLEKCEGSDHNNTELDMTNISAAQFPNTTLQIWRVVQLESSGYGIQVI